MDTASLVPASLPVVLRSQLLALGVNTGLDSARLEKLASFVEGDLVFCDIWPGEPYRLFWGVEGEAIVSSFMDKRALHRVVIDSLDPVVAPVSTVESVRAQYPGPECAPVADLPALVRGQWDKDENYCWAFVVRDLFLFLERSGFPVLAVDNGEGSESCANDIALAISQAVACDEAHFYCSTPNGEKRLWGFLVLGNHPSELVCDYASRQSVDGREFDSTLSAWSDSWLEVEECPTWAQVSAGWVKPVRVGA